MPTFRIYRYILQETAVPAGLALFVFTFVLFMGRILKLAEMVINKGVPLADIAMLFASLLPAFLVITLPLSFLLGVLLGFGRLSAESEITAMKASGISLYGMLVPVLALGLITSMATAVLTLAAEPASNAAFRREVFQIASSQAFVGLQARTFNDDFAGLTIYANEVDERTGRMAGVFISDERPGGIPSTILAHSGRILSNQDALTLNLRLENGSIHRSGKGQGEEYQTIDFTTYDINLNIGPHAVPESRPKKTSEISTGELLRNLDTASPLIQRKLKAELQQRFILPLAPLLFALVAVPLGIRVQRSGRGGGFALGLLVFLTYYLLQSFTETLAIEGGWPMAMLWLPNLFFCAGGLFLLMQTARERSFFRPLGFRQFLRKIFRRQSLEPQ